MLIDRVYEHLLAALVRVLYELPVDEFDAGVDRPGTQRIGERRDQAGVAKLWARQRIAELMESTVTGADPDRVREQVVGLGVRFGLTSRYTSLVAVEKTPRLAAGAPGRARVPTPMPAVAFPRTAAGVHHRLAWMLMFALAALVAVRAGRLTSAFVE